MIILLSPISINCVFSNLNNITRVIAISSISANRNNSTDNTVSLIRITLRDRNVTTYNLNMIRI